MAVDNTIAMQYQPSTQLQRPINTMGQMMALKNAAQENQMRQFQMQQSQQDAQRNEMLRQSLSGIDTSTPEGQDAYGRALLKSGNVEQAQKFATGRATLDKEQRAAELAKITNIARKAEIVGQEAGALAMDPQLNFGMVQSWAANHANDGFLTPDAMQRLQGMQNASPDQLRNALGLLQRQAVSVKDQTALHFADLGGSVQAVSTVTGAPVGVGQVKTQSPDSKATNDRLANAGITAQSHPLVSQAILDGRIPLARVNSRTAALYEAALQINPQADINAIGIDQIGAGAGARTAGTTQANISIASDEARRMIGVARTIIPKVNPSEYPSLNAVQNAISKGTGGVEIVQLNTALNSLINSYARAINPRGTPTVSDKAHAREIVNSAMSTGQLEGTLAVMEQEMDAALAAANEGRARGTPKEGATAAPAATGGGDLVAAARAELARRRGAQK